MKRLAVVLVLATVAACNELREPFAPPAAEPQAPTPAQLASPKVIPGRYIVVFRDAPVSVPELAQSLVSAHGGTLHFRYEHALRGFAASLPERAVAALRAHPGVAYLEPDQVIRPFDSQSDATWGLDRIDQRDLPLNSTYNYKQTGAGVNAYILDTGIRYNHNEFEGRAVFGTDVFSDGRNGSDCNGHGTHVAGTVGGKTYGVAKAVKLYAVRVLDCEGNGTLSGVIQGVDWVTANHVKPAVANMSLGGGASDALDAAVRNSINAGVSYTVAAGNGFFGIAQPACNYSPARVREAMTVGATSSSDAKASWSNYGECVDLFAPGVSITSAWHTSRSATNTIGGTSMAAPHLAGAAALYLETNPAATAAQVFSAINAQLTLNKVTSSSTEKNHLLYSYGWGGASGGDPKPAAPADLSTRTKSDGRIDLSWTDHSHDEEGFEIQRHSGDGAWATIATPKANATSYSDRTLQEGTTYTYRIRAFHAGGASDWSQSASGTTRPAAPSHLAAEAKSSSQIELRWRDNSQGETGYEVYRRIGDASFKRIARLAANTTSLLDTGLETGQTYEYRVRAYNAGGNSSWSNTASATTPLAAAPAAPSGLSTRVRSDSRIDLSWADNSDNESGFEIQRHAGDGAWATIATTKANATSYSDRTLQEGRTYSYRIRAFHAGGSSSWSGPASGTTQPAAPSHLVATKASSSITLSWTNNSVGATSFTLQRAVGDGSFKTLATLDGSITTYSDTSLKTGNTYTYRVRASNAGGNSTWSDPSNMVSW